jgi:hypothetical protein
MNHWTYREGNVSNTCQLILGKCVRRIHMFDYLTGVQVKLTRR